MLFIYFSRRYIDEGRNPDKFMMDYVEEVTEESASMNVKNEAIKVINMISITYVLLFFL